MLNSLITIVTKDIKLIYRNKQLMVTSFVFPFIIFFIFSFTFSDLMKKKPVIEPFKVAIVDYENSNLTKTLIDNFKSYKAFAQFVNLEVTSLEKAKEKFSQNKLTAIVEVPSNFSASLYYCENSPLKVTINEKEPLKAVVFKNIMESYSKFVSSVEVGSYTLNNSLKTLDLTSKEKDKYIEQFSFKLILSALDRGNLFQINKYETLPSTSSTEYFLFSIALVFLMYIGLTAGTLIIQEKNNGCLYRLKTTPSSSRLIVLSKWLAFSFFSLVQALIFSLPIALICRLDFTNNLLALFILLLMSIFFIVSFSILSATFFNSEEASILFGNIFIFFIAIAGGSFIPLQLMPPTLQHVSMITPNYWLIRGFLWINNSKPLFSQGYTLISLTFLTIVFLSTAAYRIKVQER